jgi:hypothetical protein
VFGIVVDNSQSMAIHPGDVQKLKDRLSSRARWLTRLAQDFELRQYTRRIGPGRFRVIALQRPSHCNRSIEASPDGRHSAVH